MSPISKESVVRSEDRVDTPIRDPQSEVGATVLPPSSVVEPTRVDTLPQQGSTGPGDGHVVHEHADHSNAPEGVNRPTEKLPFKEQVIAYAQKTRGTVLGKPELKEHGDAILEGRTTHEEDRSRDRRQRSNSH